MKLLTEAAAWRVIAETIAANGRPRASGMCSEVNYLYYSARIDLDTYDAMKGRIHKHLLLQDDAIDIAEHELTTASPLGWIDTPNVEGCRVLAALLLAEECDDEAARRADLLHEAAMWRLIAARIEQHGMADGLCHEVSELEEDRFITPAVADNMSERIKPYIEESGGVCFIRACIGDTLGTSDMPDWFNVRILIALLNAEQCEDEAAAL